MTTPTSGMFELLEAADFTPLSKLIRDHGRPLLQDAADQELIRLDGTDLSMRWALFRADGNTQATIIARLTTAGANLLNGA
jgi:hypothetical protein